MRIRDLHIRQWFMKQVCFVCGLVVVLSGQTSSAQPPAFGNSSVNSAPATSSQSIHVIKLHGSVGCLPDSPASARGITAEQVERAINSPQAMSASVVVLDIDGPGGLVSEMQEIAEILFKAQSLDQRRVVALPRDAFSAWSMICLACKEIVVTPTSRMGAAVTVTKTISGYVEAPEGKDAVSQKMAAPWKARMRSICRFTNRCECIPDAMCEQGKQLWWSPTKGLSAQRGPEQDWKCLDDQVSVCCLTGDELVETKVAIGMIRSIAELPALLGLPGAAITEAPNTQLALAQKPNGGAATDPLAKVLKPLCEAREDILKPEPVFDPTGRLIKYQIGLVARGTVTFSGRERRSHPGVIGGAGDFPTESKRPEDDTEMAKRIRAKLRTFKNKIPKDSDVTQDPQLQGSLGETRQLIDEAIRRADEKRFDKVAEACQRVEAIVRAECTRL